MASSVSASKPVSAAAQGNAVTGGVPGTDDTEDRFMKLLVAQMRNQDPLNPLDNAQVTSQLAQINTVRGIDEMNQSLKKLLQRDQGFFAADSAALVGRRVWVGGNQMTLGQDGPARGGFELANEAQSVTVAISDAQGRLVDQVDLGRKPAGLHIFEWDGQVAHQTLPPGTYTMRVEARAGQQGVDVTPIQAAWVRSVLRGPTGLTVELQGGGHVAADQVRGVL